MSVIRVNKLENTNTSNGGIAIDSSGHVSIDGANFPTTGPLSNRNLIINGAMQIDQRSGGAVGATTGNNYISCDRWRSDYAAANKFTLQQTSTTPAGFGKSLKVAYQATANPGSGDAYLLKQVIEGNNIAQLNYGSANAKTITLSFYIQANVSGDYAVALSNGANNRSYVTSVTVSSTTNWEYKIITIPGDTTGTWASDNTAGLAVKFNLGSGANYETATTNAWQSGDFLRPSGVVQLVQNSGLNVYITGVQLEVGETATPFEHRSYGDELARCQRYYQYTPAFGLVAAARSSGTASLLFNIPLITSLRTTPILNNPTLRAYGYNAFYDSSGSLAVHIFSSDGTTLVVNKSGFSGLTDDRSYNVFPISSSEGFRLNAEL